MLADFIDRHRGEIIKLAQKKLAARHTPLLSEAELTEASPLFVDQLCDALRLATATTRIDHQAIGQTARGQEMQRLGFTVGQVVHGYGDVCQSVTETAVEQKAPISASDFQTLNLCLDDAIAAAVSSYSQRREAGFARQQTERLGVVALTMRNLVSTAMVSFESIRAGRVTSVGSTGDLHARTLISLRDLIDRSVAEVRLEAGTPQPSHIPVVEFLEDIEAGALVQSQSFAVPLLMTAPVDRTLTVVADRQLLAAALSSLLQNAFRCTKVGSVKLRTIATADRVRFELEDQCGGIEPELLKQLGHSLTHDGPANRGTGLSTAYRAAKASNGTLDVRNIPGKGCVFSVDLPRTAPTNRVTPS